MTNFTFHTHGYRSKLTVARSEDDSYAFAVSELGRHSIVSLGRSEVEALVSVLSELLAPTPTA